MMGWQCPRCGQCYHPLVQKCPDCGPHFWTYAEGAAIPYHVCEYDENQTNSLPVCRVCGNPKPFYAGPTMISFGMVS